MSNPDINPETLDHRQHASAIYAVVYQMGKVASTSIVATLNEVEGIEAAQAHFLGEKALSAIVPQITSPETPDYFFEHSLGQFIENVRITRRMNLTRAGGVPGKRLLVISLSRDPVEWIRSSVVQDIRGYLPILKSLCDSAQLTYATDAEAATAGLRYLIEKSCDLLSAFGGVDGFLESQLGYSRRFAATIFENNPDNARLFMMFLRPANWFESHFQPALSIGLDEMACDDLVWHAEEDHACFAVVRYEDMSEALPRWLKSMGLCDIGELRRENVSAEKSYAAEVASVFRSDVGDRLKVLFNETRYSRFFGYA